MGNLTRREALAAGACAAAAMCAAALGATGCSNEPASEGSKDGFTPRLDTQTKVDLDITGPFGNFEALDQVENDFNKLYPNITFYYEQSGGDLGSGNLADIFSTTDENLYFPDNGTKYVATSCVDLSGEDVDTSEVEQPYLDACTVEGKLLSLPVSLIVDGIVVNETLLEKEGLEVPKRWDEFLAALDALKGLGYTPIQGPVDAVYANLISGMVGYLIGTDADLQKAIGDGDLETAQEKVAPAFERLAEIVDGGYTDYDVNGTYPSDNYDGAIMTFFEGNVPFWVCDTEKFSGMKKRESKSEAFSAEPFGYRFIGAPIADDGTYVTRKAWYGFSVNKGGDKADYALEFVRFLATRPELENIASVKGVPCVMAEGDDERYTGIDAKSDLNKTYCSDGTVDTSMFNALRNAVSSYADGASTLEEAEAAFVGACAELAAKRVR